MLMVDGDAFNTRWETDVYAKGQQINRYPFPVFIGKFLSHFGGVPDRSAVKILEVGSGAGNNVWFFAREGFDTHAIEGSPSALEHARKRLAAEGLSADMRLGDFRELPFETDSMDFALDRGSLTCNTKAGVEAALDEIRRVMKPGGLFFSQVFSTKHSDLKFASDYADNSAAAFSGGYFAGFGRTFFADRSDVEQLYGRRFTIAALELECQENVLTGDLSASWNILLKK
jgi:SAM-dependent methyltransferase